MDEMFEFYEMLWNQNIRMISEGSCDTEDWGNDAENSARPHSNKLHFKIYWNRYFKL